MKQYYFSDPGKATADDTDDDVGVCEMYHRKYEKEVCGKPPMQSAPSTPISDKITSDVPQHSID